MLHLQHASAGSGKTFTLAQTYILNLIAYKNENNVWHIRSQRQIDDALQHILAITFTNKATTEMKQRIINNLSILAGAEELIKKNPESIKEIPYLLFFQKLTGESLSVIARAAEHALKAILNNFSYFKISTIDSFFQEILRIFTYEANLNESYQIEIDSKFVTDSAIETALHELDTRPENMGDSISWLRIIMQSSAEKNKGWNIFSKSVSKQSIYYKLREALFNLEKEDFKNVKDQLDIYFENPSASQDLLKSYKDLLDFKKKEKEDLFNKIILKLDEIENLRMDPSFPESFLKENFKEHLIKIKCMVEDRPYKEFNYNKIKEGSVFKGKYGKIQHPFNEKAKELYGLIDTWRDTSKNPYRTAWNVYGYLIPYLGLMLEVRKFISKVLERHNLIKLSDTSYILRKIIGDEDAPFVYERLGNRIDNYLIDEFQDTSQMQWDVLKPLLIEGLAKGKDSLIIGDPKQSIYRFRNANHKLITKTVPESFNEIEERGKASEDNTNWRSLTRIVHFNNYVFRNMALEVKSLSFKNNGTEDFMSLYSNVVQYPNNQEGLGYVEIRFLDEDNEYLYPVTHWLSENDMDNSEGNEDDIVDEKDWDYDLAVLNHVAPLVSNLIERGYRSKDIGILVSKNTQGKKVVESFLAYNETLKDENKKINFISEESLLISSSPAVRLIINVLELMIRPNVIDSPKDGDDRKYTDEKEILKRPKVKWNQIKLAYELFSLRHQDLSPSKRIMTFLDEGETQANISVLLSDVQTPTLTSIVESIIKTFTDEKMRDSEALFLSSFQDLISEYCTSHTNDIASFIEWWNSKGKETSVSSPASMNAVQIMTIHKSKGLEFKCVILPFATDYFPPMHFVTEWRWVEPMKVESINFPPFLPVETTSILKETIHANIYKEYYDQYLTDKLNLNYVAFTRAKNELYIFTKKKAATGSTGSFLNSIFSQEEVFERIFSEEDLRNILDLRDIKKEGEIDRITYGEPLTPQQIKMQLKKESQKVENDGEIHTIEGYFVNNRRPQLRSIASRVLPSGDLQ